MSELVDDISSETGATTTSGGSSRRLKNLVTAEKWKSPFRSLAGPKNLHKQFRDDNNVSKVLVPRKFATHPTLAAEEKRKETEARKAANSSPSLAASTKSLKDQPIDASKEEVSGDEEAAQEAEDVASERPLTESENAEEVDVKEALTEEAGQEAEEDLSEKEAEKEPVLNASEPLETDEAVNESVEKAPALDHPEGYDDDNIVETIKNTPLEIVAQPESKYEPVSLPNQETLDKLLDKPILLSHYQALNATAIGSVARTLDDPEKLIDLGSGLKLTQRQLLDIAAKRVAPVIANINDEVEKTRREDEIKREQELAYKVSSHEGKLTRDFDSHVQKIEKTKSRFNADIDGKLRDLERLIRNAELAASNFERDTKAEIETANTDFSTREAKAVEQHGSDKETLEKNHTELEATKKQEIEDSKAAQEKNTTEIEQLQEKKTNFDTLNSGFSTQIEELTAQLDEHKAKLDALKTLHGEKETLIAQNLATKDDLNGQIATSKEAVAQKQGEHDKLLAEVAVLAATLATYTAKLGTLQNEKGIRADRLQTSKDTFAQWQQEKKDIAAEIARDHERQRAEALEAAETQRVQLEIEQQRLKEERARKEQEEAEEAERVAKKEAEEAALKAKKEAEEAELKAKKEAEEAELKAKKEAEEAELEAKKEAEEAELKAKRDVEEAERLKTDPEHQRQLRIQKREEEQQRLLNEKEQNEQIYQERRLKEEVQRLELEKEIELLREQRTQSAENARLEAELVAQAKLDEIEKLKREHDARLELFRQRLEFEELQKERLLEEVGNLKKIRELKEEKIRLAAEVNKTSQVDDIQKLIELRELEVARLTKQIEYDDHDFLRVSRQREEAAKNSASAPVSGTKADVIPVSRSVAPQNVSPVADLKEKESKSESGPAAVAAGVAGVGAAVGGGLAGSGTPVGVGSSKKTPEVKDSPDRRGSLTSRFKKIADKLKGDEDKPKEVSKKEASKPKEAAKPKEEFKAPSGAVKPVESTKAAPLGAHDSGSDYSVYSVYEEVSDSEYQLNKDDPNYLEVTDEELAKHRKK